MVERLFEDDSVVVRWICLCSQGMLSPVRMAATWLLLNYMSAYYLPTSTGCGLRDRVSAGERAACSLTHQRYAKERELMSSETALETQDINAESHCSFHSSAHETHR